MRSGSLALRCRDALSQTQEQVETVKRSLETCTSLQQESELEQKEHNPSLAATMLSTREQQDITSKELLELVKRVRGVQLLVDQWPSDSEERQMWMQRTTWLQEELVTSVSQFCRQEGQDFWLRLTQFLYVAGDEITAREERVQELSAACTNWEEKCTQQEKEMAAERAAPQPTAELLEAKSKLVVQEQELQRLRVEAREAQGQVRLSEEERLKLMQQIQQLESTRSEVAGHKPGDMNEAAEGDAEIKRLRYELNEAISEREEANDGRDAMATEVRMIRENLNQHMALIEKLTILNEELMDSFNTLQQVRQRELEELTKAQLSAPDAPGASFISPTAEDSPLPASSIEHGAPLNHSTSTRENELPSNEAVAVTITPNIQSTGDNNNLEQSNGGEAAGLVKGSVKVAQATGKAAQGLWNYMSGSPVPPPQQS
mmetsp:Transcript_8364/g.30861  ORF Transcript_8364/g.30861 Transcript_8364/m.30861 type:complete len:431 (-) Transcript_8364:1898-3190(-)